jgi:hypothetical protein
MYGIVTGAHASNRPPARAGDDLSRACQQLDHRMFNRAARARSWVALAVRMNGQQHGMAAPAPSAVKHPGANVCQRA